MKAPTGATIAAFVDHRKQRFEGQKLLQFATTQNQDLGHPSPPAAYCVRSSSRNDPNRLIPSSMFSREFAYEIRRYPSPPGPKSTPGASATPDPSKMRQANRWT